MKAGPSPWDQRLARVAVRALAPTPVHPCHVTALGLGAGLSAAALFATGSTSAAGAAAGLFMLVLFLDHADGELARLTGKATTFGERFDFFTGGANYTALFIGIGVGLSQGPLGHPALVLGLAAGLAQPVVMALRMVMKRRFGRTAIAHPGRAGWELEDAMYLIGPVTWLGGLQYFFVVFALGALGYLGWTIWEFRRRAVLTGQRLQQAGGRR